MQLQSPTSLTAKGTCVTKFRSVKHVETIFMGLYFLRQESDDWSFSSHIVSRSHIFSTVEQENQNKTAPT